MQRNSIVTLTGITVTGIAVYLFSSCTDKPEPTVNKTPAAMAAPTPTKPAWVIPDTAELTGTANEALIKYGRTLVANTALYLGPKGTIAHRSNGMNCQNCHLDAGTKLFGNNFSLVATGYPRYKDRSATVETYVKKVEDCFERSLNGQQIDSNSKEMKAFVAYLTWIGKTVTKGTQPVGSGIEELPLMDRAADTAKGRIVFTTKCQVCHGKNGEGILAATGVTYTYPPLWGKYSYNTGASIYRISKFAGYVKNNMPFGANYKSQQLTNEEAWDVAAFVNSQPRTVKDTHKDWPVLTTKPYDCPTGPYADTLFTAKQHKYGPYAPIKKWYASAAKKKK